MPYWIAGIDVHKKKLAVVVADVEVEGEYQFERRWYGSNPEQLRVLSDWLTGQQIEEVVMESTAQYWKPVWGALERYWKPSVRVGEVQPGCPEHSIWHEPCLMAGGVGPRKTSGTRNVGETARIAGAGHELRARYQQRMWRTLTRTRYQRTSDNVRVQNQLEALPEEAHIRLSSLVSDLLGASARRMRKALADGESDPAALDFWPISAYAPRSHSCMTR
jgi:hypothetical protein